MTGQSMKAQIILNYKIHGRPIVIFTRHIAEHARKENMIPDSMRKISYEERYLRRLFGMT